MLFKKKYISKKIKSPDIFENRKKIFNTKNPNLLFLLKKRFKWMKRYMKGRKIIIELGSGNGCIKRIIKNKRLFLQILLNTLGSIKKLICLKLI